MKPINPRSNDPRRIAYNERKAEIDASRERGHAFRMANRLANTRRKQALRGHVSLRMRERFGLFAAQAMIAKS